MVVSDLITDFIATLEAIVLVLLSILDTTGAIVCHRSIGDRSILKSRSISDARSIGDRSIFDARSIRHAGPISESRACAVRWKR